MLPEFSGRKPGEGKPGWLPKPVSEWKKEQKGQGGNKVLARNKAAPRQGELGKAPLGGALRQFRSEWESFHGEYASTRATVVFSRSAMRA